MVFRKLFLGVLCSVVSGTAMAHEGHGDPHHQTGVLHYLVNPSHAVIVVIAAAALAFGIRALIRLAGRRKVKVPVEKQQRSE